jgi:hypothetical protein
VDTRSKDALPAYLAALLAFASAAVSLHWTLGGTVLLDTVGGAIEDLARDRSIGAIALGAAAVALKVAVGLLALALVRPWGARIGRRTLHLLGAVAGGLLTLYGGVLVLVGALVLAGVGPEPSNERALRWHVLFWDPWFLLLGVALLLAAVRARRW